MKWTLILLALAAPLVIAPAIAPGDVYVSEPPQRAYALVMQGASFNGLQYPNTPLLEAALGETVLISVTVPPFAEAHTFHMHGHPWFVPSDGSVTTFVGSTPHPGSVVDTFLLQPGDSHTFTVKAGGLDAEAGDWMYHCHFDEHMAGGMWGVFRVYPYAVLVGGIETPGAVHVRTERLGAPLGDVTFSATLDGAPVGVHAVPEGAGAWTLHVPPTPGALVLTAHSEAWGESVARVGLGGASVPPPTALSEAPSGSTPSPGHVHG